MVGFAPPAGNADAAYRYFLARGWTPAQAAGIVGNLQQESGPGLDPTIVGDSGNAFGIAQWNDRRDALHGWAQSGGMDPAALQTQLDFISHELGTTESRAADALRRAQTPEEAAQAFLGFERPSGFSWADPTGSHGYQNRVANALRLYGGGTMPQPMSSMPAPGPAAGGGQMAGGLLGVPPAPALKQGWLGGLLGVQPTQDQGLLGGFLNPQSNADTMGWLQAAAAMLQASAPSTDPSHGSFGSALGAGIQGLGAGRELGARADERKLREQTRMQVEAAIAALPPEQQAWARANPDAFAQLMLERQFGQPAGPNTQGAPSGYMWNADQTGVVPIPGAPAPQGNAPPELIQQMLYAGIDPQSPQGQQLIMQHIGGAADGPKPPPTTGLPEGQMWAQTADGWQSVPIPGAATQTRPDTSGAPSGFMWNADHSAVVPIPGAPGEPPPDTFKDEASLRGEFIKAAAPYVAIRDAYNRLQAASSGGSGASDIAMVYSYMKMLDPTSVVREGEYATAENAGGIPATVMNAYNRLINGERLPDSLRQQFLAEGASQYRAAETSQAALLQQYQGLAQHYGFDPAGIALDMTAGTQAHPPPAMGTATPVSAPGAPAFNLTGLSDADADRAYESMPSGTVYIGPDGNQYRKP